MAAPGVANAATTTSAYWAMNELPGATRMADSSGGGHTGVINSRVRTGQLGYSALGYGFDGNGGLVTVPSASSLNPGSGSFSALLRFKSSTRPSSSVVDYDLIRKGFSYTSGGDWKMEVLRSGKLFCLFRGSSHNVEVTGTTNVVDGQWHSLECATGSSGVTLRVDGRTQRTSSSRPGTISNSTAVTIGAKNTSEDETTGLLDEVRITRS